MPKISCVIPAKNRGNLIGQTIASIIAQDEADWELLVIDDHSNEHDSTENVCGEFHDQRILYYKLADNGMGVAAARNKGNILATAPFIAVMDSDDISKPHHFSTLLRGFEQSKADVVYAEYEWWDPETGKTWPRSETFKSRPFDSDYLKQKNFIPHVVSAYKRQLALDFPYNSFLRRAEDWDYFLRLARYGYKFEFIPENLAKVRKHQGSITTQNLSEFDYDQIVMNNNK